MKKPSEQSGFKIPESYFETLPDRIQARLQKTELPKQEGFKVPDGYFDTLEAEVLGKTISARPDIFMRPRRDYYLAAAAAIALLLLFLVRPSEAGDTPSFEDLASTEIEQYFVGRDLEYTTYEFASLLAIEDLDLSGELGIVLEEDVIIDYLDDSMEELDELNLETDE